MDAATDKARRDEVSADTPLADLLAAYPALATLLAFRGIPTEVCCTGVVDAPLGEHLARLGVPDAPEVIAWLNGYLAEGGHPSAYVRRWQARMKEEGREKEIPQAAFFLSCGCDSGV
jgi:hypothetical protein